MDISSKSLFLRCCSSHQQRRRILYCGTGGPFAELDPQTPELVNTDTGLPRNGRFSAEEPAEFAIEVDELLSDLYSFTPI